MSEAQTERFGAFTVLFGARWFMLPNPVHGSWLEHLRAQACTPQMDQVQCAEALYPLLGVR